MSADLNEDPKSEDPKAEEIELSDGSFMVVELITPSELSEDHGIKIAVYPTLEDARGIMMAMVPSKRQWHEAKDRVLAWIDQNL